MMRGESIAAYRPPVCAEPVAIYRPAGFDSAGLVLELADALHRLRGVVPHFWDDDSSHIGELDKACEDADDVLKDPAIFRIRNAQGKLL